MTSLLLLLLFLLFCILILIFYVMPINYLNFHLRTIIAISRIPGPKGLPFLLGHVLNFGKIKDTDILPELQKFHEMYPRLFSFWSFYIPFVFLHEPDDLEVIMGSTHHIQKGFEYSMLLPWLQEGLLISKGEKWHQRRKLLTPAFHFKILEDGLITLNKHARLLLNNMLKKNGKPFTAESLIARCTLDVISETAMGYSLNLQQDENELHYFKALQSVCEKTVHRILKGPFSTRLLLYKLTKTGKEYFKDLSYVHGLTSKIIQERKVAYAKTQLNKIHSVNEKKQRKTFLDILIDMENKDGYLATDKDIQEEVDTFMFEGHDTTNSAIVFTLHLLGKHPDVQEKVYEELHSIFGESNREVTIKDLNKMQYLEMVIKETLRMYPSVPHISRKLTEDVELSGNVLIPKGAIICITTFSIHRNPKYFPNPELFDPERFTYENSKARHPYAYLPFSAGPRNCIGQRFAMMELKTVLSTIIRYGIIHSKSELSDAKLLPLLTLKSKDPIILSVKPRLTDYPTVYY